MSMSRHAPLACVLALATVAACGRARRNEPPPAPSASATTAAMTTTTSTDAPAGSAAAPPPAPVPDGYQGAHVVDVIPSDHGDAVLLVADDESVVLPIFVGGTEALSIRLRLDGDKYQRPLTHDLLDSMVSRLGGRVWKVQVDELRGTTFIGSVFVRNGEQVVEVDSRPSDAIALALGNHVPIFVRKEVLGRAGIKKKDLVKDGHDLRLPPAPAEPLAL